MLKYTFFYVYYFMIYYFGLYIIMLFIYIFIYLHFQFFTLKIISYNFIFCCLLLIYIYDIRFCCIIFFISDFVALYIDSLECQRGTFVTVIGSAMGLSD
jgi:hypothetical protein